MKLFLLPHVYTLLLQRFGLQTLVTLLFTVSISKPELSWCKICDCANLMVIFFSKLSVLEPLAILFQVCYIFIFTCLTFASGVLRTKQDLQY